MQSQLWPNPDGRYYADFLFDDAPRGFEDRFQDSLMMRRLNQGTMFAEYGEPRTEHLAGNPMAVYNRRVMVEEFNIAGHITGEAFNDGSGFRLWLKPFGPNKDYMLQQFSADPQGFALKLRVVKGYLVDSDIFEPDEEIVLHVFGADVIKL